MKKNMLTSLTVLTVVICTSCDGQTSTAPATVPLDQAQIGDYIVFGTYEQDNDITNGKEEIEWLVLDKDGDKLLLISRYVLNGQPYHSAEEKVTWETCSLRTWLNKSFVCDAFNAEEQKQLVSTTVTADKNPDWDSDPGQNTTDQVFLLSSKEAATLFDSDRDRKCPPTAYAEAHGVNVEKNNCYWWLRTPGVNQKDAVLVDFGGDVFYMGSFVDDTHGVRPAIWIDTKS